MTKVRKMPENPYVYISVLNWNNADQTIRCLRSLEKLDYLHYRIFVVDNASQDSSVERIRSVFPEISIVEAWQNHGYAGGHKLLVDKAIEDDADLVWILNNDIIVHPSALQRLVEAYQNNREAIFGSVPLLPASQSSLAQTTVIFPRKYLQKDFRQRLFVLKPYLTYGELFPETSIREVSGLSGSSLLIPVYVIKLHGFMDPSFFLYSEEVDYCFRLRAKNVPSILVPESLVFHLKSQSSAHNAQLSNVARYYRTRNQLLFIRRHNHTFFFVWAILRNMILMAYYPFREGRPGIATSRHLLQGTIDGIRNRSGKTIAPEQLMNHST